jgi:hypothetical protein
LKQVWFSGAHSNVGGGYQDTSQADIALAWMMSQLGGLLDVDKDYLFDRVDENIKLNYGPDSKTKVLEKPWQWGRGTIYNALSFPTSIAGSASRLPNRYHEVEYDSNRPIPDKMLKNTNEMMHPSVRARLIGGKGYDGKEYNPRALAGWVRSVRTNDHGTQAIWTYTGKDGTSAPDKIMPEEVLGELEKELLARNDPKMMTTLFPAK